MTLKNDGSRVIFYAVGDIGLHGKVAEAIKREGPDYPFLHVAPFLRKGDIVFGNLEKPFKISDKGQYFLYQSKKSWAVPDGVKGLVYSNFSLLSLANNHILDCGPEGLEETISLLKSYNIATVGAGANLNEARRPVILTIKGITIGFLVYAEITEQTAGTEKAGAAPFNEEIIYEDLSILKPQVDVVIVSLHFGLMYTDYPRISDQKILRRIIDHGAKLVLGHHPHVLQGIEYYKKGIIVYSLGEFIYDPAAGNVYARTAREKRRESIIFTCLIRKEGIVEVKPVPVLSNSNLQPEIQTGRTGEEILKRLHTLSDVLWDDKLQKVDYYRQVASSVLPHKMDVFRFHIKKGNIGYLFSKLLRIRLFHFRLLLAFISNKLHGYRSD